MFFHVQEVWLTFHTSSTKGIESFFFELQKAVLPGSTLTILKSELSILCRNTSPLYKAALLNPREHHFFFYDQKCQ